MEPIKIDIADLPLKLIVDSSYKEKLELLLKDKTSKFKIFMLGAPQSSRLGMRIFVPFARLAILLNYLNKKGFELPEVYFVSPIFINSITNNVPIEDNFRMKELFELLFRNYFITFHRDLYELIKIDFITDLKMDAIKVSSESLKVSRELSRPTLEKLKRMAAKHMLDTTFLGHQDINAKATAYFLSHFYTYNLSLKFNKDSSVPLFLLPKSEGVFLDLMDKEYTKLFNLGYVPEKKNNIIKVLFSNIFSAPYFLHPGEPDLTELAFNWPTKKTIFQRPNLNEKAKRELYNALLLIFDDIGGYAGIRRLQKEVLRKTHVEYTKKFPSKYSVTEY